MAKFPWHTEHLNTLRRMARLGHTSYEIARELGVTRSAVCGKCHRLGIKLRGKPFGPINRGGVWRWLDFRKKHSSHAKIA